MVPARSAVSLLLAFALSVSSHAETLTGRVVAIQDGDTITVLDSHQVEHRIRLAGIDAPENRQPWGGQSKASLAHLAFDQVVTVEWEKRDRYQRIVGLVRVANVHDAGLAQIRAGFAWHYKRYQREQSPADREAYATAEDQARSSSAGLWRDPDPIPPWEWRHPPR